MVPKDTSNPRDWRLYQELAAQADLFLSTGRYLRDWAEGNAQEILQMDNPKFADLREWRIARGSKTSARYCDYQLDVWIFRCPKY